MSRVLGDAPDEWVDNDNDANTQLLCARIILIFTELYMYIIPLQNC